MVEGAGGLDLVAPAFVALHLVANVGVDGRPDAVATLAADVVNPQRALDPVAQVDAGDVQLAGGVVDYLHLAVAVEHLQLAVAGAEDMAGQLHVAAADINLVEQDALGTEVVAEADGAGARVSLDQLDHGGAAVAPGSAQAVEAAEGALVDGDCPVGDPALYEPVDVQVQRADHHVIAGDHTGAGPRPSEHAAGIVMRRVAADVGEGIGVVEHEVLAGTDGQALATDIGIGIDTAVAGGNGYVATLVGDDTVDVDVRRRCLQPGSIGETGGRVVGVLDDHLRRRRVLGHLHGEAGTAQTRHVGGLDVGVAEHLGAVEQQLAAVAVWNLQALDVQEQRAAVDHFDLRIARCIELAAAYQRVAGDKDVARPRENRIDLQHPHLQLARQGTGGGVAAHLRVDARQGLLKQVELGLEGSLLERRQAVVGELLFQLDDPVADQLRVFAALHAVGNAVADLADHRHDAEGAGGVFVERGGIHLDAVEQVLQPADVQLLLAVDARIQRAVGGNLGAATVLGAAAGDIQRHLTDDRAEDCRGDFAVQVLADAFTGEDAVALARIGVDVPHAAHMATAVEQQVAVAHVDGVGFGVGYHREGGVVPQVGAGGEHRLVHLPGNVVTGVELGVAIAEQVGIGANGHGVVGIDLGTAEPLRGAGRAPGLGVDARVDVVEAAGRENQIADAVDIRAAANGDPGLGLGNVDQRLRQGDGNRAATVEFDLVTCIDVVERLHAQVFGIAPVAIQPQPCIGTDVGLGVERNGRGAAHRGGIDHAAGARLHVVVTGRLHDIGVGTLIVGAGQHARGRGQLAERGDIQTVADMRAAGANQRGVDAVSESVEARLVIRRELDGIEHRIDAVGGAAGVEHGTSSAGVAGPYHRGGTAHQAALAGFGTCLVVDRGTGGDLQITDITAETSADQRFGARFSRGDRYVGAQRKQAGGIAFGLGALANIGGGGEGPVATGQADEAGRVGCLQQAAAFVVRGGDHGVGRYAEAAADAEPLDGDAVEARLTTDTARQGCVLRLQQRLAADIQAGQRIGQGNAHGTAGSQRAAEGDPEALGLHIGVGLGNEAQVFARRQLGVVANLQLGAAVVAGDQDDRVDAALQTGRCATPGQGDRRLGQAGYAQIGCRQAG